MHSLAQWYAVELSRYGVENSNILPGIFPTGTNHFPTAMRPGDGERAREILVEPSPLRGMDVEVGQSSLHATTPDADPQAVADAVVGVVNTTHGQRPFRTYVEFDNGRTAVSAGAHDLVRELYLTKLGTRDLLEVKIS